MEKRRPQLTPQTRGENRIQTSAANSPICTSVAAGGWGEGASGDLRDTVKLPFSDWNESWGEEGQSEGWP